MANITALIRKKMLQRPFGMLTKIFHKLLASIPQWFLTFRMWPMCTIIPRINGNDTVSYIANGPFVNHTKGSIDSGGRTSIIWTDGNQSVVNQTDDWNDDFNLNFTIGTIRIKQTWETTFRLRVIKRG